MTSRVYIRLRFALSREEIDMLVASLGETMSTLQQMRR